MQVKIEGLDKVVFGLAKYPATIQKEIEIEFDSAAREIQREAIRKAPKDEGVLARSITIRKALGQREVVAQTPIAIVQEFGTKKNFRVSPEFASYAASFKGIKIESNGTLSENILAWVKRKGIGQGRKGPAMQVRKKKGQKAKEQAAVAFLIARKIFKEGIRPHPFLLDAFVTAREKLKQRLLNLIK